MPTPRSEPATLDGSERDGWDGWKGWGRSDGDRREPRLRVLYHADLGRLGAVSAPGAMSPEVWMVVGRRGPSFSLLGRYGSSLPLEDPRISREQLRLRWRVHAHAFEVEPVASARRPLLRVFLGSDPDRDGVGPTRVDPITGGALLPPGSCIAIGDRVLLGLELAETRPARVDRMGLVGETDALWSLREEIRSVAQFGGPALIHGPTGAGKELVARALHQHGPRPDQPFVAVNCAALPEQLVESTLFGHKRGAFTGAASDERGLFRAADGGTLFLDELGELPLSVQPKLLRVLQDGLVVPVGGHEGRKVEVRLVAATHRDTEALVRAGGLRQDLYHRISTHVLRVPSLTERRFDVPELFIHALRKHRASRPSLEWLWTTGERWSPGLPIGFVADLLRRPFEGNVREPENLAERTARLNLEPGPFRSPSDTGVSPETFVGSRTSRPSLPSLAPPSEPAPAPLTERDAGPSEGFLATVAESLGLAQKTARKLLSKTSLVAFEAEQGPQPTPESLRRLATEALFAWLEAREYNQTAVAAELGTSRTTLVKLMDDLGLRRASELTDEEIERALQASEGDVAASAKALRVSTPALKRTMAGRTLGKVNAPRGT